MLDAVLTVREIDWSCDYLGFISILRPVRWQHAASQSRVRCCPGLQRALSRNGSSALCVLPTELVWGNGLEPFLRVFRLDLRIPITLLSMACLLPHLAPQNRKSIHSSFEHCLHETLRLLIEVEITVNAEPEGKQTRPDISDGETQGH